MDNEKLSRTVVADGNKYDDGLDLITRIKKNCLKGVGQLGREGY